MPSAQDGRHIMNFEDLKLAPAIVKAGAAGASEVAGAAGAPLAPVCEDGEVKNVSRELELFDPAGLEKADSGDEPGAEQADEETEGPVGK